MTFDKVSERPESEDERAQRPSQLTQITRAMVAIYKEQFGSGPRSAHSHYAGSDSIVCFLEGSLTPVERSLAVIGEDQQLRDIRGLFQHAAEDSFRSAIEAITGRSVVAFISGIDTKADISSEVFLLEPISDRSAE
ncbi:MAG: hypothetical protein QOC86_2910 [Gaiellales bacterium]|nr:hypothetical protein [Gaiellales bacterium]